MATIKRADGTVINSSIKEEPVKMEEIITNEEPAIRLENESDDIEVSPISDAEASISSKNIMKRDGISIEAPWYRFYKIIVNLFINDTSVKLSNNETDGVFEINISCSEVCKLAAIKKVIGTEREFGNVKVVINYNEEEASLTLHEFEEAFKDTGYLVDTKTAELPTGDLFYFPIMKKDIIQFYDDNIADYYGNYNTTVANATMEIMDKKNFTPDFLISTEALPEPKIKEEVE